MSNTNTVMTTISSRFRGPVLECSSPKPLHPLHQIAESPTHKLLLKQWLKEEDLVLRRIALKELQLAAVRRDITFLYCSFFSLQSLLLLLLLHRRPHAFPSACRRSWLPCLLSFACSMILLWGLRYKTDLEAQTLRLLRREREDSVLLTKCVDELKKKGIEFDLLKEVDALRRAKSLRVETAKGTAPVRRWSARDLATVVLIGIAIVFLWMTNDLLCN